MKPTEKITLPQIHITWIWLQLISGVYLIFSVGCYIDTKTVVHVYTLNNTVNNKLKTSLKPLNLEIFSHI